MCQTTAGRPRGRLFRSYDKGDCMSDKNVAGSEDKALWGGRFEMTPDAILQEYGASLPVDRRMWQEDIAGSKAHATMLAAQGIISREDARLIHEGLDQVAAEIASGSFVFDIQDEDIHMAIEKRLTDFIGDAGKRLHTGRSRNDQVATDARLICKRMSLELSRKVVELMDALYRRAQGEFGVVLPGYTHLQRAQPVLFSHHVLAYFWMLRRDLTRLWAAYESANVNPLGSAALAGTTYPLDRQLTTKLLGFGAPAPNSLDAVSDRDFICDLIYACALIQVHLSRLCEELILWSTGEFGFITMDDRYSTGSSIMPQKKNPDFAELTRGKTGRVIGDLMGLLTTLKSLPLAYNKDLQEDKEGVFDAVDTVSLGLFAVTGMIETMQVNKEAMATSAQGGFMAATDLADYLVGKGLPFREAHAVVGHAVLFCEKEGRTLQSLTVNELKGFSNLFADDALEALDIDKIVARRDTFGGTGHKAVQEQLSLAEKTLHEARTRLEDQQDQ